MDTNIIVNENECRICFEEETRNNKLINPCLCNGTSKYVHISCLQEWRHSNINRSSYYKCSECNYFYKFKFLYPVEIHNIINTNTLVLGSLVYTPSMVISMIVGANDQYNNYEILDNLYKNTSNYTKFKEYIANSSSSSLYWMIILNYVLYIQQIIAFFIFYGYIFYNLNLSNYKRYIYYHSFRFILHIVSVFKFIIAYTVFCSWNQYSNLICTLIIFSVFEVCNYYVNILNHNKTIHNLEYNNPHYILNYDPDAVETENVIHLDNVQRLLEETE